METKIIDGNTYTKVQGGWQLQQAQSPAPERGFAGELLPTAFSVGGSIIGGIAGTAVAPGPGTIAGGIGGATVGGAIGETIQQEIEKKFGERKEISMPQIAATGAISGVTQAAGGILAKGIGIGGSYVASKMQKPMIAFFKTLSGYNDEMITKALTQTEGVQAGLQGGEKELTNLITRSSSKVSQLAKDFVKQAHDDLIKLSKTKLSENSLFAKALSSSAGKYKAARTEIFNKYGDFSKSMTKTLREMHNIGVDKYGVLNFARPNQPSRIVGGSEQKAIQEASNLLKTLRNNLSLKHVDSVYERLVVLKSKTPTGTPTGTETKAVIGDMLKNLNSFIKDVYPKEYTQYL